MVLVAASGPVMNIFLAVLVGYLPVIAARWLADNLKKASILAARAEMYF
jgi:hypothetical protein